MTDISLQKTAKTAGRARGRPFAKGQSGNPGGRPRGSTNRATRAAELLLDGEAAALTRKAVELALAGDPQRSRYPGRDKGGLRRGRARRHHPRRGVRNIPDDRKLSAGNRRGRLRKPPAGVGGKSGSEPSRSLWAGGPIWLSWDLIRADFYQTGVLSLRGAPCATKQSRPIERSLSRDCFAPLAMTVGVNGLP